MRKYRIWLLALFIIALANCNRPEGDSSRKEADAIPVRDRITGKWVRKGPGPSTSLHFKKDGTLEGDLMMDGRIEVVADYSVKGNHVEIADREGQTCTGQGVYEVVAGRNYIGFDLVNDTCYGRIRATIGYWTRPGYEDILIDLDQEIERNDDPELLLERARMMMALGKSNEARADLDAYLKIDSTDARVYMNRAGTRFPYDLQGVISDCTKALALDPNDKNSYHMRGLARFELGQKAKACEDFSRAIELGFTFLKKTEAGRCAEFRKNKKESN